MVRLPLPAPRERATIRAACLGLDVLAEPRAYFRAAVPFYGSDSASTPLGNAISPIPKPLNVPGCPDVETRSAGRVGCLVPLLARARRTPHARTCALGRAGRLGVRLLGANLSHWRCLTRYALSSALRPLSRLPLLAAPSPRAHALPCAAHAAGEHGRCRDALSALAREPVSREAIVEKQLGRRLKPLRASSDAATAAAAKKLTAHWKAVVLGEAKEATKEAPAEQEAPAKEAPVEQDAPAGEAAAAAAPAADGGVAGEAGATGGQAGSAGGAEGKAEGGRDEGSLPEDAPESTGDGKRDRQRALLAEKLALAGRQPGDKLGPHAAAAAIEVALQAACGSDAKALGTKFRSIATNLGDPKNPDFRRKILSGLIDPQTVPQLSSQDMASDKRKAENAKIREDALFQAERGMTTAASTDMFKCGRCRKNQCTYFQMQTRSADEPMTTFVTCVNCNNRYAECHFALGGVRARERWGGAPSSAVPILELSDVPPPALLTPSCLLHRWKFC